MNPDRSMTVIERARRYVAAIPGAVSGQGGHNQTFAVASAVVHGFALEEGDAWIVIAEYNARCNPPWSERELQHKIRSAMQSPSQRPRGYLLQKNQNGNRCDTTTVPPVTPRSRLDFDPVVAITRFVGDVHVTEDDWRICSPYRIPKNWPAGRWHHEGA